MVPPCAVNLHASGGFAADHHTHRASIIELGGPTQIAMSPSVAAGMEPIITVGAPGPTSGPPTCGIGGNSRFTIGTHVHVT
jgi:hypothetical protein